MREIFANALKEALKAKDAGAEAATTPTVADPTEVALALKLARFAEDVPAVVQKDQRVIEAYLGA